MVKRAEARWGKLQGALHEVAPLVVGKANDAQWKKWLRLPLALACRAGQPSLVKKLLAAGAEPASAGYDDRDGLPLIHSAVLGNSIEVFEALLRAGCRDDLDAHASSAWGRRTPLLMAVWGKSTAIAEALLAAGADATAADAKGLTALHLASIRADVPMMRRLLAVDGVDLEVRTRAGLTPLFIGMCNRQVESVKFLLEAGAAMVSPPYHRPSSIGIQRQSCLITAVKQGYNEMISILIEAGADVHERMHGGWSVMCMAARAGNAFAVHALSDAGAPVVESDGDAPLFYAIRNGRTEAVKALLARGTDVNIRTRANSRKTPLHVAAQESSAHVVRVLLDHGADVASLDDKGKTPECFDKIDAFNADNLEDLERFSAFPYDGREWEGWKEHAACTKLMLKNEPPVRNWARRRALIMLIARHKKGAAVSLLSENGGRKRLACCDGGGAPAALPVGGGASEGVPGDGGTTTAEGALVAREDALRSLVARVADLGEQHLLRRVVLFL